MLEEYKKNGFVILKQFFSWKLLKEFEESLQSLLSVSLEKNNISSTDYFHKAFRELDKKDHSEIKSIYETLRNSDKTGNIIYYPPLVEVVKELLGMSRTQMIYLIYHICRLDPPEDGRFLYGWHQQSFYSVFEADEVQLWMPVIGKNTKEMGTISILEGSHKRELPHYIHKIKDGHEQMIIPDENVKGFKERFIEIELGDILLFHPYLIHRSNQNFSEKVRYSIVASYASPYDKRFKGKEHKERTAYHNKRCKNYEEKL